MFTSIVFSFWFFAPAGFANLAAFVAGKVGFLKKFAYPVDCYTKFRGKRVLGDHKTFRGFLAAVVVGILICSFEVWLYSNIFIIRQLLPLSYETVNPVLLGSLLGFGALFGDALKSFFKRQANIHPGTSWFPFDQIDYIVGGVIFSLFYIRLPVMDYVVLFIIWFLMHPLTTFVGYLFKLRHNPL